MLCLPHIVTYLTLPLSIIPQIFYPLRRRIIKYHSSRLGLFASSLCSCSLLLSPPYNSTPSSSSSSLSTQKPSTYQFASSTSLPPQNKRDMYAPLLFSPLLFASPLLPTIVLLPFLPFPPKTHPSTYKTAPLSLGKTKGTYTLSQLQQKPTSPQQNSQAHELQRREGRIRRSIP